jgi:glycine/D-amino acid oxidase-like deaminating enzyme
MQEVDRPKSTLWWQTSRENSRFPPAQGATTVDVAVIGGGILGLSAALHLAHAGASVAVLEAETVGHGASGRNGGLVVPSLPRVGPDDAIRILGDAGARLVSLVLGAPGEVFGLIGRHGIDCDAVQSGWLNPAHAASLVPALERRLAAWRRHGSTAVLLDAVETQRRIGSPHFHGAIADPTGGHLNPLAYTNGLARVAAAVGARVHEQTRVLSVRRQSAGWRLELAQATVVAAQVLQATNAATPDIGAARSVRQSVVPLIIYELATAIQPAAVRATLLPGNEAMSDTRNNLFACAYDGTGRLVTGGMAPVSQLGAPEWLPRLLARRFKRIFPQLPSAAFTYVWRGRAALTRDFLPRAFELAPGWLAPISCNGRGIALSTAMGRCLSEFLLTGDASRLPVPIDRPRPLPVHALAGQVPQLLLPLGMLADRRAERRKTAVSL